MTKPKFFPDFFIVGAPRCGTSALSRYLKKHPQICFSKPKEPHFFSRISPDCTLSDIQANYLNVYFSHYHERHQAVGEGSVSYLFAPQATDLILKFNPDAKFIAMVRNPIDMIRSYHQRLLYVVEENVTDFATAWDLQEFRARGERLPKGSREPRLLQYALAGKLGQQIEKLFERVGREKCLVIVFDDFVANTELVYRQVQDFLNVDYDNRKHFQQKRVSKGYKSRYLQRLLFNPPLKTELIIKAYEASKRKQKGKKKSSLKKLRKRLLSFNTVKKSPPPLDDHIRTVLREAFSSDIKRLGVLLDRDLSHWQ